MKYCKYAQQLPNFNNHLFNYLFVNYNVANCQNVLDIAFIMYRQRHWQDVANLERHSDTGKDGESETYQRSTNSTVKKPQYTHLLQDDVLC